CLSRRLASGTIRTRVLQRRVQRDRHDGEGQQAIPEDQRMGVLHLRSPSVAVRRDGGGVADQLVRRRRRRQRRENRYDLDSVLSAASRQGRLLGYKGGDETWRICTWRRKRARRREWG